MINCPVKNPLHIFFKKLKHETEYKIAMGDQNNILAQRCWRQEANEFSWGLVAVFVASRRKVRIRNISPFADDSWPKDGARIVYPPPEQLSLQLYLLHTIVQLPNGHNSVLTKN